MGKTFVYNTGASKDEVKKDDLHLIFGVFIDGTLNNKNNTDMRTVHSRTVKGKVDYSKGNDKLESEDEEKYNNIKNKGRIEQLLSKQNKTPAEKAEFDAIPERDKYLVASYRVPLNEFGLDRMGTDNSYSNDYTNVARMWQCCEQEVYAIYVPGMGTDNLMRDSQDGFAFGSGQTGIRARVRNACEQVADKVAKELEKGNENTVLTQITLDIFGFSRGAATARNLVYEVNHDYGYAKAVQKEIPNGVE
ncbi:phospholipase effector Tle1 domain-containing protein, partial [Flavobacterium araucananum]